MKKILIILFLSFLNFVGNLVAQTPNNTLYVKLPDASGYEDNSYLPEMNKFVEDMVKELPEEFQNGNFKVFELGCYPIREVSKGAYREIIEEQLGKDIIANTPNILIVGKRCENGIYTSFDAFFKFSEEVQQCFASKNAAWETDLSTFMRKKLNDAHQKNNFDYKTTHKPVKESLELLKFYFKNALSGCSDYGGDIQNINTVGGNLHGLGTSFKSDNNSELVIDFKAPFVIYYNDGYNYIKMKLTDSGVDKITDKNEFFFGNFSYDGEKFSLFHRVVNGAFLGFFSDKDIDKEVQNQNLVKLGETNTGNISYKGFWANKDNIRRIPICSILKLVADKNPNCDEALIEIIETGVVNADRQKWIAFLQTFQLNPSNAKDLPKLAERVAKMTDAYFKVFIAQKLKDINRYLATGLCANENLDLQNFKLPNDVACQNAIFETIFEATDDPIALLLKHSKEDGDITVVESLIDNQFKKKPELFSVLSGEEACSVLSFILHKNFDAFLNGSEKRVLAVLENANPKNVDQLFAQLQNPPSVFIKNASDDLKTHSLIYFFCWKIDDQAVGVFGGSNYTKLMQIFVDLIKKRINNFPETFQLLKEFEANQAERTIHFGQQGNANTFWIPNTLPQYINSFKSFTASFENQPNIPNQDFIKTESSEHLALGLGIPNTALSFEWSKLELSPPKILYLEPFDLVNFNLCANIPMVREFIDQNKTIEKLKGEEHFIIPAVFATYAAQKLFNKDAIKAAEMALDVATLATGVGEVHLIYKGISQIKNVVKAVELANAGMNLTLNLAGENLKGTPFEKVKEYTDYILMASLVKNVAKGATKVFNGKKVASIEEAIAEAAKLCGGNKGAGTTGCDLLNMTDDQLVDIAILNRIAKEEGDIFKLTADYQNLSAAAKAERAEALLIAERNIKYCENQLDLAGARSKYDAKFNSFFAFVESVKTKLKQLNWSELNIDKFLDNVKTAKTQFGTDLLKKFGIGDIDLAAAWGLLDFKNLSRILENQEALTFIKKELPSGYTIDDVRAALNGVANKGGSVQDGLDAIYAAIVRGDLDQLKGCFSGKIIWNQTAELIKKTSTAIANSAVDAMVAARKNARKAIAESKLNGTQYDDLYKAEMRKMIDKSEEAAEAMSDLHFEKNGTTKVDFKFADNQKSGRFDRVYKNPDGSYSIVECKGGGSPLKGRGGVGGQNMQGTEYYIESVRDNLIKLKDNGKITNPSATEIDDLLKAINSGNYTSYVFRQPFDELGNLKPSILSEVKTINP